MEVRDDPVRVQVANQQLINWCERHRVQMVMITAAAAVAAALHRSRGDAPLLDAVRDRNAASGMFVNGTGRSSISGKGIMMQPCRS